MNAGGTDTWLPLVERTDVANRGPDGLGVRLDQDRLVPGFVVDTRLEDGARIVTFGNGMVARELIVDLDEQARRLAWSARGGRLSHHNASVQVFADGEGRSRLVWIADLLPNELAGDIRAMIEQAAAVMKPTLEGRATGS